MEDWGKKKLTRVWFDEWICLTKDVLSYVTRVRFCKAWLEARLTTLKETLLNHIAFCLWSPIEDFRKISTDTDPNFLIGFLLTLAEADRWQLPTTIWFSRKTVIISIWASFYIKWTIDRKLSASVVYSVLCGWRKDLMKSPYNQVQGFKRLSRINLLLSGC